MKPLNNYYDVDFNDLTIHTDEINFGIFATDDVLHDKTINFPWTNRKEYFLIFLCPQ